MSRKAKVVLKDGKAGTQKVIIIFNNLKHDEVELMVSYAQSRLKDELTVIDRRKPQ